MSSTKIYSAVFSRRPREATASHLFAPQAPGSSFEISGRNILCNPKSTLPIHFPSVTFLVYGLTRYIMLTKIIKAKSLSSFNLGLAFLILAIITPSSQGGAIMNISQSQVMVHTELQSSYIPLAYRREVFQRDDNCCQFCGRKTKMLCHDLPKCRGGKTEPENLLVCCEGCRREKGELTAAEYRAVKLEQIDFPREVKLMRIKVIFPSGDKVEGIVEELPNPETKAFWLRKDGNGTRELIYTMPGMRIIELGGGEK